MPNVGAYADHVIGHKLYTHPSHAALPHSPRMIRHAAILNRAAASGSLSARVFAAKNGAATMPVVNQTMEAKYIKPVTAPAKQPTLAFVEGVLNKEKDNKEPQIVTSFV
jgi:hypothetical protein